MVAEEIETTWIENWYEIRTMGNEVVAIGEPNHQENVFSYFIKGKSKDLLIDTGMGVVPIFHVLEKLRNSSKELVVVNTHWHFDHVGGNSHFEKILVPSNGVEISGLIKGWSHKDLDKYAFFDSFRRNGSSTIPAGFDLKHFFIPSSKNIDPVLKDDYIIDLGDRILSVIETPGHTPGSVSLFDKTNGLLFPSDLLYEGPLYSFDKKESNPEQYLQSLQKIKRKYGSKIITIHPGHNYPENSYEPNLLDDAIHLFDMAVKKMAPDDISSDIPEAVEYKYPGISRRTDTSRRLKVLINKDYISLVE